MVYKFDPVNFNGFIFLMDDGPGRAKDSINYIGQNLPIPASYFPKILTIERASSSMPDLFHVSRGDFVVSERARVIFERMAPGEVEFIPVQMKKAPTSWLNPIIDVCYSIKDLIRPTLYVSEEPRQRITMRLNLADAYYFINILGRAQRMLWLQTPTRAYGLRKDGTEHFGLTHDFDEWRLCGRSAGEPLIWQETWWRDGNREYTCHSEVLVEDVLWRELDAAFPGQLHPLRVGDH
jgi:hypothetical protein